MFYRKEYIYEVELFRHFFYLEFLKISCRTDIVDKDQTTQTIQSDAGSTLCVFVKNVTFKWQYSGFNFGSFIRPFLAHLSTTCSRGTFRIILCPSSVVRRPCVVNNFFKHQLLLNRWANLNQTWQECSLGGFCKIRSQNLIPFKTPVAMVTKRNFSRNSLNLFSSGTAGPIFKLFHRIVPCVTLFKNCSRNFHPYKKHGRRGRGGGVHCVDFKEILQNYCPLDPPVRL